MRNWMNRMLVSVLTLGMLAGCGAPAEKAPEATVVPTEVPAAVEPVDVRVTAMKGPTAMGMVELMKEAEDGEVTSNNYSFELLSAVDEIGPKIAKKEADILCVPANLGAVLYQNMEHGVQVLAVNTLGVLYIVETGDTVHSVEDLKGKTIYASGKGATPEYALNYILSSNNIDPETDVTIEWKSEHAECVAALAQDPEGIAMLPQPFVTAAQVKNDSIRIALDLNELWSEIPGVDSTLITGIVIARKEFAEENPEAVQDFLTRYAASVDYVNSHIDEAAALIGGYDIIAEPVAKKALPYCNIVCVTGAEMKQDLSGYLNVLYTQNPKSVGGELPAEDFYYGAE